MARAVQQRRRQPRGDPPQHDGAEERRRDAGREPPDRRHDAAGRGHAAREPQPQVVRKPVRGVPRPRVLLAAARDHPPGRRGLDRLQQARTSAASCSAGRTRGASSRASRLAQGTIFRTPTHRSRAGSSTRRRAGTSISEAQYSGPLVPVGPTIEVRLDAHGVAQETRPSGSRHPARPDAARPDPDDVRRHARRSSFGAVARSCTASRLFECPFLTAAPRTFSATLFDGQSETETLAIGNIAPEVDEPLELDDHGGGVGLRVAERPAVGERVAGVRLDPVRRRQHERRR